MSDKIFYGFKALGITPAQSVIAIALAWGWITTLSPMPKELSKLNDTVAALSTKVEIHAVLIAQITELNGEVRGMRKELANLEGKFSYSHGKLPQNKEPSPFDEPTVK